jgi:hypothetical protein
VLSLAPLYLAEGSKPQAFLSVAFTYGGIQSVGECGGGSGFVYTSCTGVPWFMSGGVFPIVLSRAACSSDTCGIWSSFPTFVPGATWVTAGFFVEASSLAGRCWMAEGMRENRF